MLASPGWQRTPDSTIISIYSQFLEQGDAEEGLCQQLAACSIPFCGALRGCVRCSRSRVSAGCPCAKPQSCCCTRAPGRGAAVTTCAAQVLCCWFAFTLQHSSAREPAFLPSLAEPHTLHVPLSLTNQSINQDFGSDTRDTVSLKPPVCKCFAVHVVPPCLESCCWCIFQVHFSSLVSNPRD